MRVVKHPNVVDLRAFFYSNGDKVSFFPRQRPYALSVLTRHDLSDFLQA